MARQITVEELMAGGFSRVDAERAVKISKEPKPRLIFWKFKATVKDAAKVAEAFPKLIIEKRFTPRSEKEKTSKTK